MSTDESQGNQSQGQLQVQQQQRKKPPKTSEETIPVPEGITVSLKRNILYVSGPLGKTKKDFRKIPADIRLDEGQNNIYVKAIGSRKRNYEIFKTAVSLIRGLIEGVQHGYTIKMKIVYSHFPITAEVKEGNILIKNFQGERAPRVTWIRGQTQVKVSGDEIVLTGPVLTDVSQTAAALELDTQVRRKDQRVFLDGVYRFDKQKGIEQGQQQ